MSKRTSTFKFSGSMKCNDFAVAFPPGGWRHRVFLRSSGGMDHSASLNPANYIANQQLIPRTCPVELHRL
jgi:hypothetical protein